jgi:hypothetical protein
LVDEAIASKFEGLIKKNPSNLWIYQMSSLSCKCNMLKI